MSEPRSEHRPPVRCLSCNEAIERLEMEPVPYLGQYGTRNRPCGCADAGVLFDFTALSDRSGT